MSTSVNQDALRTMSDGLEQFSSDFFKELLKNEKEKNIICSPTSISVVLLMVAHGARGNTEKELRSALYMSVDDEINKSGIQSLIDVLNGPKKVDLRLANKIYIADNYKILAEFKSLTETIFRSASESINFHNIPEALKIINDWCSQNTKGLIKDVLQPIHLQLRPALILINAVYFKGSWAKKFNADMTKHKPFYIDKKTTKTVPTMSITANYNQGPIDFLNAQYIELPYESNGDNDSISMFIILPNDNIELTTIADNLHNINYKELHDTKKSIKTSLELPKFKIQSTFELNDILKSMGMKDMFESSANFQGISGNNDLLVSKVIHKAFIEVNEEGSEAAAVTAVMMVRCMPRPPREFIVNRPFFCVIMETSTGMQLFNAKVVDPTEE